jgi:xanthine dehydrogenase accessory factor
VEPQRSAECTPIEAARRWLEEHDRVVFATVVSSWGSAPVPVGGQLAVAPGERFEGSVSGGCVEVDVITEAADVLAEGRPRLLEFGVADETAWRAGLPCGGTIKVSYSSRLSVSGTLPFSIASWKRAARASGLPL